MEMLGKGTSTALVKAKQNGKSLNWDTEILSKSVKKMQID
jgi:hypothetical protein